MLSPVVAIYPHLLALTANAASVGLETLTQAHLDAWVQQACLQTPLGHLPGYIPLLSQLSTDLLAVQIQTVTGMVWSAGDLVQSFVLMSTIKPFLLLFLLELLGADAVFQWVGMDPSDQPFHSLVQLNVDRGRPRNPMLNSGAIALADRLPGKTGAVRCETLRQWLNQQANCHLVLDPRMLSSVRSLSNETNRSIAKLLAQAGYIGSVELALDTYNHICCLAGTVADLARLGLLLVQSIGIDRRHQRLVNTLMLTCGLYEASGRYAARIGLPTKSGVSGTLLAVVPRSGVIACYSPAIDAVGNSVAGLFLLETLAQELQLSVFG